MAHTVSNVDRSIVDLLSSISVASVWHLGDAHRPTHGSLCAAAAFGKKTAAQSRTVALHNESIGVSIIIVSKLAAVEWTDKIALAEYVAC
jgi:hypothetical protein